MYIPLRVGLLNMCGLEESMQAMRLPKDSVSDTARDDRYANWHKFLLGKSDAKLAGALIKAGSDHAKAIRGVVAYIKLDMQVGWMIEFETYRHGVECLSTSSSMHGELKELEGSKLAEAKQANLSKKVYTRIVTISYQALRGMYKARRSHRHPDWTIFCDFIEDLPYFKELIMPELREKEYNESK